MKQGDAIYTPRFCAVKIAEVLSREEAHAQGFTEPTHYYAVARGFDIKNLSELLGHSSVRFTLEKYVHGPLAGEISLDLSDKIS